MKVAVIILNWNGSAMLRRFLPSVIEHTIADGVSVVVADNGSTDNSCELVERDFPQVCLIKLGENYGFAEGYNRAIRQVDSEYVVLLNNDVEVTAGWLGEMVAYMDANPGVGACQPKLLSERNRSKFEYAGAAGGFIDRYGYPFCRGRVFEAVEEDESQYDEIQEIFWASGAAMLIRKTLYEDVGGLDGSFFAHSEEIDLCWRLVSRGYKIVCLPFSKVYHVGAATLKKESPRKTYLNFRNNRLMLYKNLPEKELGYIMGVRFLLDIVAAFVFLLQGNVGAFNAVFKALRDFSIMKKDYVGVRKENISKTVCASPEGRYDICLPWESKVRGKRLFSELQARL